jgi:hypothetical protein
LTIGAFGLAALRAMPPAALSFSAFSGLGIARAAAIPDIAVSRKFNVFWGKDAIGTHMVSVTPAGAPGDREVAVDIDMLVDLGMFGEITYVHSSREVWRDGRIVELESRTDDDGDIVEVSGLAKGDYFLLQGPGGPFEAPGHLLTSNCAWSEAICHQSEIIDATTGTVVGLVAKPHGNQTDPAAGPVRGYKVICPMVAGSFWYDTGGLWARGTLERSGEKIDYFLDT